MATAPGEDELQDSRVVGACSFNLGAAYVEAEQPEKGLDFLRQAQPGPKADRLPDLQFNLALAHNALGQRREAAAYFLQAAQLYRSQGDGRSEGDACMEMSRCYSTDKSQGELYLCVGVSYWRLRCFQEAVACLQRALSPAAQQPPLLARVLHNLGAALNSAGRFPAAHTTARAGPLRLPGLPWGPGRCFSNLGYACSQLGDEEEAAESFILALQGFRDTEDHLSEVQVCESLAECYLKQRKQQKAVQLYKQALKALSHCQDSSGSARDRLVERLTAALQQSLQRSHKLLLSFKCLHRRRNDITQSPGTAPISSQTIRGEGPDSQLEAAGRQEAAEHCGSAGGGASEEPEYMSMVPGLHSSEQSEERLQGSELCSDRENTCSDTSLVQEPEAPAHRPR
ncbi:hypothetical protein PFLUV_G00091810 [Perca fluviatilis]|uniref:MalT-like TPR region domain-containing protein n=1 Tax=Perca fluviatilis TaxID=8168 RepID=A0A6A5FFD7_PERFL|nr:hypothetical protein PFLUV_G00091810 [Perca fluviatilis]